MSIVQYQVTWRRTNAATDWFTSTGCPALSLSVPPGGMDSATRSAWLPISGHLTAAAAGPGQAVVAYLSQEAVPLPPLDSPFTFWWVIDVELLAASPAAQGDCSVRWHVDCYDPAGAPLSAVDFEQRLTAVPSFLVADRWPGTITSVRLDSAAWPDPLVDQPTQHLTAFDCDLPNRVRRFGEDDEQSFERTNGIDCRGLLFPNEGNVAVAPDGRLWISRRRLDASGGVVAGIYRRNDPAGGLFHRVRDVSGERAQLPICRLWEVGFLGRQRAASDSGSDEHWTSDGGLTWNTESPLWLERYRPADAEGQGTQTDVRGPCADLLLARAGVAWNGTDQVLAAMALYHAVVTPSCRQPTETGCLPQPRLWRNPDGTWSIGAFCGAGNWRQWRSAGIAGLDWTLEGEQLLGEWANLDNAQFVLGRDGRQVAVSNRGVLLTRRGTAAEWQRNWTSGLPGPSGEPYLWERPDGRWECGWMDPFSEEWSAWWATDPAGEWRRAQ